MQVGLGRILRGLQGTVEPQPEDLATSDFPLGSPFLPCPLWFPPKDLWQTFPASPRTGVFPSGCVLGCSCQREDKACSPPWDSPLVLSQGCPGPCVQLTGQGQGLRTSWQTGNETKATAYRAAPNSFQVMLGGLGLGACQGMLEDLTDDSGAL